MPQHVLPGGSKRIRCYGLLSMPAAKPQGHADTGAFMKRVAASKINTCHHCYGPWRVVEQRGADVLVLRGLPPRSDIACRGPQ
ncbi:hypothetical protein DBR42_03895 [Pelomonas sp. HMWF004]|nr:hypothetical protein DBR42_03895 [Pelomonas sp. HMWF004]